ncbi:hypothetical protein pb186bvf_012504 [Paramecium bursaria]
MKRNFYFNVSILGGKLHTECIKVEATIVQNGEKLDTLCTWFLVTNRDIIKLELQGNQYQPSIDDVGNKFMIQVVPVIEGRDYEGMPKSFEVGPLQQDPSIQESVDELLENEKMTVLLDVVDDGNKLLMNLTLDQIELTFKKEEQIISTNFYQLSAQYPQCQAKRGTDDQFYLEVNEETKYLLKSSDNQQRDIILTVIKGFYGKSVWKKQQQSEENIDEQLEDQNQQQTQDQIYDDKKNQDEIQENQDQTLIPQKDEQISKSLDNSQDPPQQQNLDGQDQNSPKDEQQLQNPTILTQNEGESGQKLNIERTNSHNRGDLKMHSVIIDRSEINELKQQAAKKEKKANADMYMLINENARLKQENESLLTQLQKQQDNCKKLQKENSTLQDQLNICTKNFYAKDAENEQQKKQIESLSDQKCFLQQDINLYKGQILECQEVLNSQKSEIEQLQRKLKKGSSSNEIQELKQQIELLKEQLAKQELISQASHENYLKQCEKVEKLEVFIEEQQNQIKHEQKRYESLAIEKGIKQSPISEKKQVAQSSHQLEDNGSDNSREISIVGQSCINLETDSELARLKHYIQSLEATLRSLKCAYEQDVRYTKSVKSPTKTSSSSQNKDLKFIQGLTNSMTEIITEKDLQLENQKAINRQLLEKIRELEKR